jgi:Ca-activated chloride channel family protein
MTRGEMSPPDKSRALQVDVNLVLVPVTVTDSKNRPLTDFSLQDFAVTEDGVRQSIQYFSKEDAPISIGLILDLSGSMRNKVEYERQAVTEFLSNANPQDDYFAILVSSRPELIATSEDSLDSLEDKLAAVTPKGGTSLFDAIYLGVSRLHAARYQRRALLIVSDGGDNSSRYTLKEIKTLLQESDVMAYAIGVFDDLPVPLLKTIEERCGRKWLDELTEISGGRDLPADTRKKIPLIAAAISRELRSQYVLGYRPSNAEHDGKWHRIKVAITPQATRAGVQLHFKKGYYASATTYAQVR